jgi:hypothetical protein
MRIVQSIFGIALIGLAIAALIRWHSNNALTFSFLVIALGIFFLKQATKNRPLLPDAELRKKMLHVASQHWRLGMSALGMYILSIIVSLLGRPSFFGYNQTWPEARAGAILILLFLGFALSWRFLELLRKGARSTPAD